MTNVLFNWKMSYYLKQITRSNQPIIIPLTEAEVIVGSNNLQLLRYPQISEQHAKFYKIEDRIYIRDLSSQYGTYVNDVRFGSDIKSLTRGDIIGFGVNAKSGENGFFCILINKPFEESYNIRNQPLISIKKEPPEIIDLSDDDDDTHGMPKILIDSIKTVNPSCLDFKTSDVQENAPALSDRNMENLIREGWEYAKHFNDVPSTSRGHTSIKKRYPRTKKCSVPLIRCDSESFLRPSDIKNPFLLESEDEDIFNHRRIISDSFVESSEEESPRSYLNKPENKQNQFNNNVNVSKSSSRVHPNDWKNLPNHRKKRARNISFDSSDESSVESNKSVYRKSKKSFLNESKTENIPSSGFVALPELPSSVLSVEKADKNVTLNKKFLSSFKIPNLSTSNSSKESLNRYFHLNSLNKSNMETDECSSRKSYQLNIQKIDVGKKLFPTRMMEYDLKKDSYHEQFNEIDSGSVAEEILNVSDGGFNTDTVQNSIYIKTEHEDAANSESDNIIKDIFEGDDESEVLPSSTLSKNSVFDSEETESIETIQQYVNCSAQKNPVESEYEGNEELNAKLTTSESKMSPKDNFLPSVKGIFRNSTFGVKKSSKSCGKTLLTEPKPMTYRPRKMRGRDEGYVERQKPLDLYLKRKRRRPRKEEQSRGEKMNLNIFVTITKNPVKSAEYNPSIQKQLSEITEKCKKKVSGNDYLNNKGLPSSISTKDPRKNTKSSVKVRPDKFCSRMGFLTNGEEPKPVRRDKISGNSKKYKGATNAEKNETSQTQFTNKIRTDEKNVVPGNVFPISYNEDKHFELKISNISHTLQDKNSESSVLQKISHSLTNALDIDTLGVKNLEDDTFQGIPISSADAPSTRTLQVKNLRNSNFHNISHFLNDTSHGICMDAENIQEPFEFSFNGMVKSLLKLETVWLQEQRNNSQPPPEVMQGVETLPLCFTSYKSYAASFYPLLKLKIWQNMVEKSPKEVLHNEKMRFRVLSFVNKPDCIELKCESLLNDKCCFEPREGMMTVLEMYLNPNTVYPLFGFIFKHKVNTLNENLLHPCWRKIPAEYLKDAKRWIFHVWIKQKELLLEPDLLMKGSSVCYLRNDLRLVDALQRFEDSPLMTDIIKPRLQTFVLSCSKSFSSRKYTARQSEIIQAICSEIYKPYLECKITLIHGPPGMGKTHIIIGILETLFYASKCNSNLKVLVTAPSNVAVDEIGCRLIELNERYGLNNYAFKFVRVGVENKVHSKMLPYFIDRNAADLYKKHKERELQALRLQILNLEKEPNSLNKNEQLKSLNDQCKIIKDNISLKIGHYKTEIKYKCDILNETNIVLTTLSSCNLSILRKTFLPTPESDLNFSCCIVDESTQCSEIEILQPLAFGFSKLILIGDERQLPQIPAVHLEYAKKYQFDRSMLNRFCQYFIISNQPSPAVYLTE